MTLRSVLILLSLCTLICSDSMSHFRAINSGNIANVMIYWFTPVIHKFYTDDFERDPPDSVFKGFESCAEQCLVTKFYCRSFMVMALCGEMQCIMEYTLPENLEDYFDHTDDPEYVPSVLVAAYDIKRKINNVATIIKDPNLLSEDRFHELLRGYGIAKEGEGADDMYWDCFMATLKTCKAALNIPKSRPKIFRKWLNGEESYYKHSMPVSTSKSTDNYEHVNKRQKVGDRPDFNLLMFLDLYSRAVDENTETIYDPEGGTLYIHSPEFQMLFISHDKDDYIWVACGNKISDVQLGVSKQKTPSNERGTIVEDFVKTARRFNPDFVLNVKLIEFEFDDSRSKVWRIVTYMTGHWECELSTYERLMYDDLSQVVPILHEERTMPYTEQVRKSFPRELVDIITQ